MDEHSGVYPYNGMCSRGRMKGYVQLYSEALEMLNEKNQIQEDTLYVSMCMKTQAKPV